MPDSQFFSSNYNKVVKLGRLSASYKSVIPTSACDKLNLNTLNLLAKDMPPTSPLVSNKKVLIVPVFLFFFSQLSRFFISYFLDTFAALLHSLFLSSREKALVLLLQFVKLFSPVCVF